MTDYEKAAAEFLAKQAVTVVPAVTTRAEHQAVRKSSFLAQKERERAANAADKAERNAENKRFDNEGVYYIGGKE